MTRYGTPTYAHSISKEVTSFNLSVDGGVGPLSMAGTCDDIEAGPNFLVCVQGFSITGFSKPVNSFRVINHIDRLENAQRWVYLLHLDVPTAQLALLDAAGSLNYEQPGNEKATGWPATMNPVATTVDDGGITSLSYAIAGPTGAYQVAFSNGVLTPTPVQLGSLAVVGPNCRVWEFDTSGSKFLNGGVFGALNSNPCDVSSKKMVIGMVLTWQPTRALAGCFAGQMGCTYVGVFWDSTHLAFVPP